MAEFEPFWQRLLSHEGRTYTNDPNDSGGPTKFGITLNTLKRHRHGPVTAKDVEGLQEPEARGIAHKEWWPYDSIESQPVAERAADFGFNTSSYSINGVRLLQNACNHLGCELTVDGRLGPMTINAVNAQDPNEMIPIMKQLQRDYYWSLIAKLPDIGMSQWGWTAEEADMVAGAARMQNLQMAQGAKRILANEGKKLGNLSFIKGWLNRVEEEF